MDARIAHRPARHRMPARPLLATSKRMAWREFGTQLATSLMTGGLVAAIVVVGVLMEAGA